MWEAERHWEHSGRKQWYVKRYKEVIYHRDKLLRVIYFETWPAARKRAQELNAKEKGVTP